MTTRTVMHGGNHDGETPTKTVEATIHGGYLEQLSVGWSDSGPVVGMYPNIQAGPTFNVVIPDDERWMAWRQEPAGGVFDPDPQRLQELCWGTGCRVAGPIRQVSEREWVVSLELTS